MPSRTNHEGYLLIDNRLAPPEPGIPRFVEAGVLSCSHCQVQVIRNPARERPRAYCTKCDHYICDNCAPLPCRPWKQLIDQAMSASARGRLFR